MDEAAYMKAELYGKQIEEDEVETRPDTLYNDMEILLDPVYQKMSKKYFTDDAWMVVTNVLNILQGINNSVMQHLLFYWHEDKLDFFNI